MVFFFWGGGLFFTPGGIGDNTHGIRFRPGLPSAREFYDSQEQVTVPLLVCFSSDDISPGDFCATMDSPALKQLLSGSLIGCIILTAKRAANKTLP